MHRQRRILIVDDEDVIRDLLSMLLSDEGFLVTTASNGHEALQQVAAHLPDLILLDLWMPVMDGYTFYRHLVTHIAHVPPVVVISADRDAQYQAATLGVNAFVAKPFDVHTLMDVVERYAPAA